MKEKPSPGDRVCLNDHGIKTIGGIRSQAHWHASRAMRITSVSDDSLCDDVPTWDIHVDQPMIDQFMITNHDVELLS